jgi:phenylacetate-CoA ligase
MTDVLLKTYHCLPNPLRSVAASLRGFYLRSWRYGPETDRLVEEAIDREHWSIDQWKTWRENRLAYVLDRAAKRVPFYRELWAARRRKGDKASWQYLENWPILEKDSIRENPLAFVANDCDVRKMFREHTSGTSGKSLTLWWSVETVREWYALAEARWRYWNGVTRDDRWAMIGGQLVTPVSQREPPFWVWNKGLNQLYMSSYHLAPDLLRHYLDAIRRYEITYLFGYSSSLYALAQAALEAKKQDLGITLAIANAEPLYDYQRNAIAQAFMCPVRETYGMAEIVAAASECAQNSLHTWPEVGWIEVMEDGHVLPYGASGDFVCTGLLNADMPLIRYKTGDRGVLADDSGSCPCGRTLPLVKSIEGRADDVLQTIDGRRIGRLDPLFKGDLRIHEAQIIQEALNRVRVRYVPTADFKPKHEVLMANRLRERMGSVDVVMESLSEIPRGANGKFRAVISKVTSSR